MKKLLILGWMVFFLFINSAVESGGNAKNALRVRDGKIVSFEQMIDDLKKVSVVFVGEVHDVPDHHHAQLAVIDSLHQSELSMAIGLEMFRIDSQPALDTWSRGKLPLEQFLPAYYDNWRMPWPLYRDIFEYARDHQLPLVGLNIPDGISKKIARSGFASLTQEEKKILPPGISCNVDPTYMEFIRRAYSGHHGHGADFVNFCEAQMVWDKSMAWHAINYLRKNSNKTMVVLAGVGHAWKRGIPDHLSADSKLSYRVVLPAVPNEIDRESVTTADADYVLLM